MDGQTYAVAEYENQQNHVKSLETYIKPIFEPKGGGRFAAAPLLVQVLERCRFLGF